jgi:hypothetical protein
MKKSASANTAAINLRVPPEWIETADVLAEASEPVKATRSAILRAALGRGLAGMMDDRHKKAGKKNR